MGSIICILLIVAVDFHPLQKKHKGLLARHLIDLLHQVNVVQTVNKVIQIHNSAANNLCNLLDDQSIELLMDWNKIKLVHQINILIKDSTHIVTKENYSIITLDFQNLDDITTTFMNYSYNEMSRTKYSNNYSNQYETQFTSAKKYSFLIKFGIPTYLFNPNNIETIRYTLR